MGDISYQIGLNQQLGTLHEKGKFNIFSVMAGIEVFFNSTVGLEMLLGYRNRIVSIDDMLNSNKKGFQVSIGFQIHLEKN